MPAAIMRMDSLQSVILKYQNKFTQVKLHMIATNVRRAFLKQKHKPIHTKENLYDCSQCEKSCN